jgi:alkylresorcinol/alkylpyrone synthase
MVVREENGDYARPGDWGGRGIRDAWPPPLPMSQADLAFPSLGSLRRLWRRDPEVGSEVDLAPSLLACRVHFPDHRYAQDEVTRSLAARWSDQPRAAAHLRRFQASMGVEQRCLALPLAEYDALESFGQANDAFVRVGTELASRAVADAVARAGLALGDIDAIFFTTITGVSAPSLDARVINTLRLRSDIRRTPMFGLGCLGGAAGLARASDYLRAYPRHVAVLLSVELCSLTLQDDTSVASIVAAGLFGDGAGAVVLVGAEHPSVLARPPATGNLDAPARGRVRDARSVFFHDTERVMGWDVGENGFKVVLSADVPTIARERLPPEIDRFLARHGLERRDVGWWVCHPGGPKVIAAIEEGLDLPPAALAITRSSLASVGNLSSASVLHVLERTAERAASGDIGILLAMGPGFCAELVLLEWA